MVEASKGACVEERVNDFYCLLTKTVSPVYIIDRSASHGKFYTPVSFHSEHVSDLFAKVENAILLNPGFINQCAHKVTVCDITNYHAELCQSARV